MKEQIFSNIGITSIEFLHVGNQIHYKFTFPDSFTIAGNNLFWTHHDSNTLYRSDKNYRNNIRVPSQAILRKFI